MFVIGELQDSQSLELCVLIIICMYLYLLLTSKGQHCFIFIMYIWEDKGQVSSSPGQCV